jgi:hypothetical protein
MKNNNFKNFILFIFIICTIIFGILFIFEMKNTSNLVKLNIGLKAEIDNVNLAVYNNKSELNTVYKLSKLQSWDIKRFQKKGLTNPEKDILDNLSKQTKLIKFEPQPGVTWRFDINETIILSNRWIFTKFDEGHFLGSMLLKYNVDNGSITWEVISQYLD